MLNEERVKLMVQLASYEQKEGKEDFKVSSYYKKDYVSFHRLATMIWTTIGYWIASGRFYQKKHSEARARVKKYSHNLLVLNKLYEKENM